MALDVLLIAPRSTYVDEIAQKVYPPLNLLYLAASLREHGQSVEVLDANAWRMSDEQIASHIRQTAPLLVGIPVYSEILRQVRDLARIAKANGAGQVVLGGPHVAAVPRESLEYFPDADFVLCGEAEETLPLLVRSLKLRSLGAATPRGLKPAALFAEQLANIPGLWWRADDTVRMANCTGDRPDIHRIHEPARDLVAEAYCSRRYYAIMVRDRPVDTIMTSRGCPFACNFCYNTARQFRGRSPEDVLGELGRIREQNIRNVEIVDDHFTVDRKRAMRIFELIIREKLGISFRIKSRVDVVDAELLDRAREAGAYQVSYGTESGVQQVLDAMNKRITVEQIVRACELTRRAGLACHTSWVLGYPGETPATIAETVDLIVALKPTTANLSLLRPYPETVAYHQAQDAGMLEGRWHPDEIEMPWVKLPWVRDRAQLKSIVKKAMRRIYCRPYYAGAFGANILRNANWKLAGYAWQELRRVVRSGG